MWTLPAVLAVGTIVFLSKLQCEALQEWVILFIFSLLERLFNSDSNVQRVVEPPENALVAKLSQERFIVESLDIFARCHRMVHLAELHYIDPCKLLV